MIQLSPQADAPPAQLNEHADRGDGWCARCGCAFPCPGTNRPPFPWWRQRLAASGRRVSCTVCEDLGVIAIQWPGPDGQGITYERRTCPQCLGASPSQIGPLLDAAISEVAFGT